MSKKAVYFDMDGVLCDWVARYNEYVDLPLSEFNKLAKPERSKLKAEFFNYDFFRQMKPIKKGMNLLKKYAKDPDFDVFILSASGDHNISDVTRAKKEWIKQHVGSLAKETFIVKKLKDKPAKKQAGYDEHVLIDDRDEAIVAWKSSGSKAILFKEDTEIKSFKEFAKDVA